MTTFSGVYACRSKPPAASAYPLIILNRVFANNSGKAERNWLDESLHGEGGSNETVCWKTTRESMWLSMLSEKNCTDFLKSECFSGCLVIICCRMEDTAVWRPRGRSGDQVLRRPQLARTSGSAVISSSGFRDRASAVQRFFQYFKCPKWLTQLHLDSFPRKSKLIQLT